MPTNLPPEYFAAEERYKQASGNQEKIDRLEELIGTIPKHKGTDKLRADLRRRLSRLKETAEKSKKAGGRHESAFHIEREGSARVILVGTPNVGKSSLLTALTNAKPIISESPFSTWHPTPGMLEWEHVQIQLIDTPPLNRDHIESEQFDLIRSADLLLILIDLQADAFQQLEDAVSILKENRINITCQNNTVNGKDKVNLPVVVVINKYDDLDYHEDLQLLQELMECDWPTVAVSGKTGHRLESLPAAVFRELKLIRVYSKPPGKGADLTAPFVMREGGTVEELAGRVHKDFLANLKSARVWGTDVYDGQQVGRDHVLHDGDIVELHT